MRESSDLRRSDIGRRPLRSILRIAAQDLHDASPEADALLLDLDGAGRALIETAAAWLANRPRQNGPLAFLRVSASDSGGAEALAALCPLRPDAIIATRAETGADLQHLGALLAVAEAKAGFEDEEIGIVAVAETAGALFGLIGLAAATRRLVAIGWDGEALGRDLGGETREDDGRWSDPLQTARTLTLAAAADARLPAIDSGFTTRDADAFRREVERAKRDGFAGKFTLDPGQAAIVAAGFGQD